MKKQDPRREASIDAEKADPETTIKDIKKKDLWRFRGGGAGDSIVFAR